jgi:hypothetical protein
MIRYRSLFEDLTGLREGRGEPARARVAAIHDRAAAEPASEPATEARATRDPVAEGSAAEGSAAEGSAAEDRDLAVRNDERAAESASRTANPPR